MDSGENQSPLSRGLATPFATSLVRDLADNSDVLTPLLAQSDIISEEQVLDHLMTGFLRVAYAGHPGHRRPRYSLQQAQQTLSIVAAKMGGQKPQHSLPGGPLKNGSPLGTGRSSSPLSGYLWLCFPTKHCLWLNSLPSVMGG